MKKALLGCCMLTALTVACGADQQSSSTISGHPAFDAETASIRLAFSQARMVSTGAELMPRCRMEVLPSQCFGPCSFCDTIEYNLCLTAEWEPPPH